MRSLLLLSASLLVLAGCTRQSPTGADSQPPKTPTEESAQPLKEPPATVRMRGQLSKSGTGFSLGVCGEKETRALRDHTGGDLPEILESFGGDAAVLYVELEVQEDRIVGVRRAAPVEIDGCAEDWSEELVKASGNEPFWHVALTRFEVRWTTPEGALTLPKPEMTKGSKSRTWRAWKGETTFELFVSEERCADSMSGQVTPYTAQVTLNGTRYSGCSYMRPDL